MHTGLCRLKLHLPETESLKAKRRIVKSLISRLRHQYNISVAEVDDHDLWQMVTLGIACVSNHSQHADEVLSNVLGFITQNYRDLQIVDHEVEILHGP